jgi:TonB family protein
MNSPDRITKKVGSTWARRTAFLPATCAMTALWGISLLAQAGGSQEEQSIPGTPLSIKVPQGWHIEPGQTASPPKIVHDIEPRYSIGVIFSAVSVPCARKLTDTESRLRISRDQNPNQPVMTLAPSPSFLPEQFAPRAAFIGRDMFACMDLGTKTLGVIVTPLGDSRDLLVRPVLEALVRAASTHVDYISAPGPAKLPTLEVEIKLESGQYLIKPSTINGKPRDTIVRLNSEVPLEISFIELKPPNEKGCSAFYNSSVRIRARSNPPYVQGPWYPSAWEWSSQGQLLANACYEASPQLIVVAWIQYGRAEVDEQDARLIRELLNRLADSVDRGPHTNGHVTETLSEFFSSSSHVGGVIGGIISSTPVAVPNIASPQRVRVSLAVSEGLLVKKVEPMYPPLARQARIQGTVLLQAEINKDGTVDYLHLISGHPMLVPAAIEAVKRWVYRPYVLNNAPVAVETQVQVNFILSNGPPGMPPPANSGLPQASNPP